VLQGDIFEAGAFDELLADDRQVVPLALLGLLEYSESPRSLNTGFFFGTIRDCLRLATTSALHVGTSSKQIGDCFEPELLVEFDVELDMLCPFLSLFKLPDGEFGDEGEFSAVGGEGIEFIKCRVVNSNEESVRS